MVRKAFRADLCRIVFIPVKYAISGVYMEGPFNFRQMMKVDLKGSLAADVLTNSNCTSITMPSNLVCSKPFLMFERPENYSSVTNQEFEAVKYLSILKSNGNHFAIIEIGWNSLA